jgi:formylmethanofuran dehydrogenase subunit B
MKMTTCLGCGCTCDDIDVVTHDGRIVEARHACALGVAWFGDGVVPARALVRGRAVPLGDAIGAAAELVTSAARPLVYLAPDLSCEAQREAVALADHVRACLDTVTSASALGAMLAAQEQGRASATLGEVRNRADLVVFWGVDPAVRYPRYGTRYAPEPAGVHVPDGRRSRTVVSVDVGGARGPSDCDLRVSLEAGDEVATLAFLSAMVSGVLPFEATEPPGERDGVHARLWTSARQLAAVMVAARYVVVVADAEDDASLPARDAGRAEALAALSRAINRSTRGALSTLRGGGNRSGADAVLTWQTGYPTAVDFARGVPQYRPYDGTCGAQLSSGASDAVLVIGSAALLPAALVASIGRARCAVIGPRATEGPLAACEAAIDTGVAGIHDAGMAVRMDDLPVPLRQVVGGPPRAADVIGALRARLSS